MKNLIWTLLFLSVFVILTGFGIKQNLTNSNSKKDNIEVIFNRRLKFDDLVEIKNDLSEKGITLDFKKLEFDENGGLLVVYFKVDCNDGFSGSAGKSNLTNQCRFGFYRNYSNGSENPFGTGGIK